MSPSTRRTLWIVGSVGLVSLGGLSIRFIEDILGKDALVDYRPGSNVLGGDVGVLLEDVSFKHYRGMKLTARGKVDRIEVLKNRNVLHMIGVSDGYYRSAKGDFRFSGDRATIDNVTHTLNVQAGARVWNTDVDLRAPEFTYVQATSLLTAKGKITGKFYDGQLAANNLVYNANEQTYRLGPVAWSGTAESPLQEVTGQTKPSEWRFKTEGIVQLKNGIETWANAEATDGDVIIRAPKITRDTKTDTVTATGKVEYFSLDANLVCDKAVIFRKEKRALLTGNVRMLIKPESEQKLEKVEVPPFRPMVPEEVSKSRPPAPPEDRAADDEVRNSTSRRKYPVAMLAAKIEYWYKEGSRRAVITGSPQARQDMAGGRWRAIWTTTAYYDGEKELLKLVSAEGKKSTRVKTSLGDDLICTWFEISTKEDDDAWQAMGAEGVVYPDENEVPRRNPPPNQKPPPLKGQIGA